MKKQYSFLEESFISDFFKDKALCTRAYNLREKVAKDCIFQIKKIKDFYKQHRIDRKTYLFMLSKQQDKLARLQLRLSNLDLI